MHDPNDTSWIPRHLPESEAPPRIPSREELGADRDRHWCRGCNTELVPELAEKGMCTRCQAAPTERPLEPTLANIYDAVMGVASDVRALHKQLDRLSALHVSRHPQDAELFREGPADAA